MERIVVLGLGNILSGDEGFGVRVAERLYSRYAFPDNVEIVDAGTQGHPLLAFVERATRLLLLDAVDFGLQPGTTVEKDSTGIPAYLSAHKMSLHQNSFSEVLGLAALRGALPRRCALLGVQPDHCLSHWRNEGFFQAGGFVDEAADGEVSIAFVNVPGTKLTLELMQYHHPKGRTEPVVFAANDVSGARHVALKVTNIEAAFAQLSNGKSLPAPQTEEQAG